MAGEVRECRALQSDSSLSSMRIELTRVVTLQLLLRTQKIVGGLAKRHSPSSKKMLSISLYRAQ